MQSSRAMLLAFTIIALSAFGLASAAWGARVDMEVDSLRGLGSVYLIVQSPNDEMTADGLDKAAIKTSVTKQLSTAGINVLKDTKDLKDDGAILLIAMSSIKGSSGLYACSIDAELIQITSLARDPKTLVPATTWTTGLVAIVDPTNVKKLQDRVSKLVDEFIKDYQSANLPINGGTKTT